MRPSASAAIAHDDTLHDAVADHLVEHGIADLTFRSLANVLDISTYKIVYHFGSRAQLIDTALRRVSQREIAEVQSWMARTAGPPPSVGEVLRRYWAWCLRPRRQAVMRLFIEAATLAMRDPEAYPPVVRDILQEGIDLERQIVAAAGGDATDSIAIATLVNGTVWGLQLDLIATGDAERTTAAVHRLAALVDDHLALSRTAAPIPIPASPDQEETV